MTQTVGAAGTSKYLNRSLYLPNRRRRPHDTTRCRCGGRSASLLVAPPQLARGRCLHRRAVLAEVGAAQAYAGPLDRRRLLLGMAGPCGARRRREHPALPRAASQGRCAPGAPPGEASWPQTDNVVSRLCPRCLLWREPRRGPRACRLPFCQCPARRHSAMRMPTAAIARPRAVSTSGSMRSHPSRGSACGDSCRWRSCCP